MKKPRVVIPDWAVGTAVGVVLVIASLAAWSPIESIEMKLYDLRARLRPAQAASDAVAVVGIDKHSIDALGRWPWPRTRLAETVDFLTKANAKVIGMSIFFTEAEQSQGLAEIRAVRQQLEQQDAQQTKKQNASVVEILTNLEKDLNNDEKLAGAIFGAEDKVVLPVYFDQDTAKQDASEPAPKILESFITQIDNPSDKAASQVVETGPLQAPLALFADVAGAFGHLNVMADSDGIYRNHVLLVEHRGQYFPSFAGQLVARYLNLKSADVHVHLGGGIRMGKIDVPTDAGFRMAVDYSAPADSLKYYPIAQILQKQVSPEAFAGKIVIIGVTHPALGEQIATPVAAHVSQPEVLAHVVSNILQRRFIVRPSWASTFELITLVLFGAFVALALPRLGAGKSAIIAGALLVAFCGAGVYLFISKGFFIKLLYPVLTLALGYAAVISKKYLITEQHKQVLEVESAETNKMLGLSFQGQGMLDLAYEKFRRCPVDEVKEEIYNLGLDFERKRQFTKAASCYQYIAAKLPKFKDIETRIPKLVQAGETIISGTAGLKRGGADATVMVEGSGLKPTLGRYEIIRELGKGAMGVVYLGKDPKINRMVAIKTLRFEDDLDPEDSKALKERFFREAESAGRLSHPNIVTIFDTGEDQEMCYIAMELLDGRDLKDWCPKDKLFPMKDAVRYSAEVADALHYAHEQGIVHRDIKPANIMLLKNGVVKVTDFGIARITTSSRTATGTVMGTPSYMSPEQLSGKKVDGRSDLFSLGVTLYELLTGEKPFTGESIATLMFKIANERHDTPRQYNANVPESLVAVIDKALMKSADERYQHGKEMAAALRAVLFEIEHAAASGA